MTDIPPNFAAVRQGLIPITPQEKMKLEKDGLIGRIAYRIRSEKTLNFLFEHSRKEAAEATPAES